MGPNRKRCFARGEAQTRSQTPTGLRLLYLTPLRALSRDLALRSACLNRGYGLAVAVGIPQRDTQRRSGHAKLKNPPQS